MPGPTLHDLVAKQGPLPPEEAVAKVLDVIEGLQQAHRQGVVHRDVKPSNCFLDHDGRVKVGDFGLAKSLTADSTGEQASAGLDRLTPEELRSFSELNDSYRARFGFPFIMAVKGKSKAEILAAFRARLANNADAETTTALAEIDRIAAIRLKDILP